MHKRMVFRLFLLVFGRAGMACAQLWVERGAGLLLRADTFLQCISVYIRAAAAKVVYKIGNASGLVIDDDCPDRLFYNGSGYYQM